MKFKRDDDMAFEDAIEDDWSKDLDIAEVSIGNKPMVVLGAVIFLIACAIFGRVIFLNLSGAYYEARAENNVAQADETSAPRGIIYDREGNALAENKAAFAAVLDARTFLQNENDESSTLATTQSILGISPDDVMALVASSSAQDFATPVVLAENLNQNQLVNMEALDIPSLKVQDDFERDYPNGPIFSSVIGYTGRVTQDDLEGDPGLKYQDFIGKTGLEAFYDDVLRGTPGVQVTYKNAQGKTFGQNEQSSPVIGKPLTLTIDGGLQAYFYNRLAAGLQSLGRTVGVGIAMDPQTGQILSLINMPSFDNNVFSEPGQNTEIENLLTSPDKPLFNRAVTGFYNPGSTIKPLDGVAGLTEGVIDSTRDIFSPGYVLVPNPYDPSMPTKYLDWQYQGSVDLASALAQSSDVYFYIVGGGSPAYTTPLLNDPSDYGIKGLGPSGLYTWWQKFGLGKPTGIDMPNEAAGFLPTPAWKQQKTGKPWLQGDTYNVAIGQGDLLMTPLQLIDYSTAIANGGKVYRPYLNASSTPQVEENLTQFLPEIEQVQAGMRATVDTPRGTAYTMNDLPFPSCGKSGSAQIQNNTEENALFIGYAPCGTPSSTPQIIVLVLIENSKQGSLNAIPIAKDVLNWWYQNREVATSH
jgi:penicillin-binding protein 2